jgi:hypothetical protein
MKLIRLMEVQENIIIFRKPKFPACSADIFDIKSGAILTSLSIEGPK